MRGYGYDFAYGLAAALAAAIASLALASPAAAQAPDAEETVEMLPNFAGREETFGYCAACHSFKVVGRQGMDRARWDETLTWMTQKQAMPEPDAQTRRIILDYLAQAYPVKAPAPGGGFVSPFAPR